MAESYLGIPGNHHGATFDKLLELVPSGTEVATTGSEAVFIGSGLVDANLVIDVPATPAAREGEPETAGTVKMQFCAAADFAAGVVDGITTPIIAGRSVVPFRNDPAGTPLGYVRIVPSAATKVGAFIAKR